MCNRNKQQTQERHILTVVTSFLNKQQVSASPQVAQFICKVKGGKKIRNRNFCSIDALRTRAFTFLLNQILMKAPEDES